MFSSQVWGERPVIHLGVNSVLPNQRSALRKLSTLVGIVAIISLFVLSGFAVPEQANNRLDGRLIGRESQESVKVVIQTNGHSGEALLNVIRAQGCEITFVYSLIDGLAATCPGRALVPLSQLADVTFVEADDPANFPLDASRPQVKGDLAFANFGVNGSGVKVAVLDSGINKSHSGFAGVNWGEEHVFFSDFNTADDTSPISHGTHTTCIIACTDSTYKGIAFGATILNGKIGDDGPLPSAFIAALEWAVNKSADVVLAELGAQVSNCSGTDSMSIAVNKASNKTLVVIPAGNSGPENNSIWSPGCAEHALTVGAINDGNNLAIFSSGGPTGDGRMKPDIVAPGVDIISAHKFGGFEAVSGTSFSAPHAAGAAALMKQARSKLFSDELKAIIRLTADDLGLPLVFQGTGRLDVEEAVNRSLSWAYVINLTHNEVFPSPAPKGQNFDFVMHVNNTGNTEANATVATVVSIVPGQLNLVNDDPVHNIGVVLGREHQQSTWVMKANRATTYTVTFNLTADGVSTQAFSRQIVVQ